MKIEIYHNSKWVDITDNVEAGSLTLQTRHDEAFASGNCTAWLNGSEWKYNIPPYTPLKINDVYYVCSSSCTKYLTEADLCVHNIDILESTAILSCFIVGTKYFSVTGTHKIDYEKIKILSSLMNTKYGITFTMNEISTFTSEKEYNFKAGSTLFDCLNEIAEQYNTRVYVSSISDTTIITTFKSITTGSIDEDRITNVTYSQSVDSYGAVLETEAKNVVDRTTLTVVKNLSCRADDVLLNNDTAKIYLPTPIEKIVEFGIQDENSSSSIRITRLSGVTGPETIGSSEVNKTYAEFAALITYNSGSYLLDDLWNDVFSKRFSGTKDTFYAKIWHYIPVIDSSTGSATHNVNAVMLEMGYDTDGTASDKLVMNASIPLESVLLEKSQYDLLTPANQTSYAVYTTGSNVIENLNASYKEDIWNTVLGEDRQNFLISLGAPIVYNQTSVLITGENSNLVLPMNNKYYCKYYSISNPVLYDEKDSTSKQLDGTSIKNYSRTYGNSASLIDFDKVSKFMSFTNNSTGLPEMSMEYDATDLTSIPEARQYFTYDSHTWYISSVVTTYGYNSVICVLNCVKDYNKTADCIGTDTEFTSTKNDLKVVVERPLFFKPTLTTTFNVSLNYYFRITFDGTTYFIPAAMLVKDNICYLYAEALDQYALASYRESSTEWNIEKNYKQDYASYVDSNNECNSITIQVVTLPNVTLDVSFKLPIYTGTYSTITSAVTRTIYKDARERLTFTMKIKLT